jgi:hypothetical protein
MEHSAGIAIAGEQDELAVEDDLRARGVIFAESGQKPSTLAATRIMMTQPVDPRRR